MIFFIQHRAKTPLFYELPQEFIAYLTHECDPLPYPFVPELAHYEWVELGLSLAEDEYPVRQKRDEQSLLTQPIRVSPLAWLLHYHYPVHEIDRGHVAVNPDPQGYYFLAYRDRQYHVCFMQLNASSAWLFQILQSTDFTGQQALDAIIEELHHPQPDQVYEGGLQSLQEFYNLDLIF